MLSDSAVQDCLRVAAKKEAVRLKPSLIELAKTNGVTLSQVDFDVLENSIFERLCESRQGVLTNDC